MPKIQCTEFVKRQTKDSPFSYFTGSWTELEAVVAAAFSKARAGYKLGVLLVNVLPEQFYSGVVTIKDDTQLTARFKARRDGEAAFIDVAAHGDKTLATYVDIVLYSRALLVEEGEQVPVDVDYEIVSINARTQEEPEPMTPMAMARNFLGLPGGTKAEYTAEQFAKAILYWSTHAMHGGAR